MIGIVFLGPPGSGKGTIAKMICRSSVLDHFSMGDVFRKISRTQTDIGKNLKETLSRGELVEDSLVMQAVGQYIKTQQKDDSIQGFVFDGIPRTMAQAKELDDLIKVKKVFLFCISDEQVLYRLTNRLMCKSCSSTYNVKSNPPKIAMKCDECDSDLIQREDDGEKIAKNRLEIYKQSFGEIVRYYKAQGKVCEIDASLQVEQIVSNVVKSLSVKSSS